MVLRNLKDVLASLHYFRGEPKDGWLGNEHGPGSLARFLAPDCPNAFGSAFDFVRGHDALVKRLGPRAHVVYYEELQHDAAGGMQRLFHALSLSPLKVNADGQFAKMPSRPLWQAVPRENWAAVCRAFGRAKVTTPAIERECRRSPSRRRSR